MPIERHDTPVDLPATGGEEHPEWGHRALQLKAEGYTASVVAVKLIEIHGVPEDVARSVAGRIFGKKVNPRAGETTTAILMGLVWVAVGLAGAFVFYSLVGFRLGTLIVYGGLLGLVGKGMTQIIIAAVNSNADD